MLSVASLAVSATRRACVSGVFACMIHSRAARRTDGGKALKFSLAAGFPASAFARSGGGDSVAMESRRDQLPSAFARSMAARPAFVMRPSASSCLIFVVLRSDHALAGLRGLRRTIVRSASSLRGRLSIQPKQSASSTTSLQGAWRATAASSRSRARCLWCACGCAAARRAAPRTRRLQHVDDHRPCTLAARCVASRELCCRITIFCQILRERLVVRSSISVTVSMITGSRMSCM